MVVTFQLLIKNLVGSMGKYSCMLEFIIQGNKCSHFYMALYTQLALGILYNYCISAFRYDATQFPDAERTCILLCSAIICYAQKVLSIFCSARAPVLCISIMGMKNYHFQEEKQYERKTVLTILTLAEEYVLSVIILRAA